MDSITAPPLPDRLLAMKSRTPHTGVDAEFIIGKNFHDAHDYFCSICLGLPRYPASLKCGHIGCEVCLRQLTITPSTSQSILPIFTGACPLCRTTFTTSNIVTYQNWPLPAKLPFKNIDIQCHNPIEGCDDPSDRACKKCKVSPCEFKGSMEKLVDHEKYECPNRFVDCPNPNCFRFGRAKDMTFHFQHCISLRINCPTCGLPVLYAKKNIHNCITDLQKSIQRLSKCLLEAHKPVKRIWLPGNPGEVCQFGDSEDEEEIYSDIEESISSPQQSQGISSAQQPLNSTPRLLGEVVQSVLGDAWHPASWRTPSSSMTDQD